MELVIRAKYEKVYNITNAFLISLGSFKIKVKNGKSNIKAKGSTGN